MPQQVLFAPEYQSPYERYIMPTAMNLLSSLALAKVQHKWQLENAEAAAKIAQAEATVKRQHEMAKIGEQGKQRRITQAQKDVAAKERVGMQEQAKTYRTLLREELSSEDTAYIKNWRKAKEEGYKGSFTDFLMTGRAITAAQSDPQVRDPLSGVTVPDVLPKYMQMFGVERKQVTPSMKPQINEEKADYGAQLKGKKPGQYQVPGTDTIVIWNGQAVVGVRKKIR